MIQFKGQIPQLSSHKDCKSFLLDAGNYLSRTKPSDFNFEVLIQLEDILFNIKLQLNRWQKTENISIQITQHINLLLKLSSSLVVKIREKRNTELDFFDYAMKLGEELILAAKMLSTIVLPILYLSDVVLIN